MHKMMKRLLYQKPDIFIVKIEAQTVLTVASPTISTGKEVKLGTVEMEISEDYNQKIWTHSTGSTDDFGDDFGGN